MLRYLLRLVLLSLAFGLSLVSIATAVPAYADSLTPIELQVVDLVNQHRAAHGLPALRVDARLTQAARAHTNLMREREQPSHQLDGEKPICQGDDRLVAAGYAWIFCAENVAAGQTSAEQVVNDWMNSAGHRENILSPYAAETGIAFSTGGNFGTWWTQTFGAPGRGQAHRPNASVSVSTSDLRAALLVTGESRQVMQFNPAAALQRRLFADGFTPNSGEFRLTFEGVTYAAQRAERLDTGRVRVYYVGADNWANVLFVDAAAVLNPLAQALAAEAARRQVIEFNPAAALQKGIFATGYVPNSPEYSITFAGEVYTAQRAENLGNGRVQVFYVRAGHWSAVQMVERVG